MQLPVPLITLRKHYKDKYFNIVPFLKFSVDTVGFYNVLKKLGEIDQPVTTETLLGHLKSDQQFLECSLDEFKRHYMLKLYGLGYTQYSAAEDMNEISETGMEFLVDGLLELEKKLSQADTLAESKTWPWFEEEKI